MSKFPNLALEKALKDIYGLSRRQFEFCVYYLARNQTKGRLCASKAGFNGDLYKRTQNLLENVRVQAFLAKFSPPPNKKLVVADVKSLTKKLEQMASGEIDNSKTAGHELKALELLGRSLGLFNGPGAAGKDRLREVCSVFLSGPVTPTDIRCDCGNFSKFNAKYCGECGVSLVPESVKIAEKIKEARIQ